jgi:hypothetical protein
MGWQFLASLFTDERRRVGGKERVKEEEEGRLVSVLQ